MRVHGSGNVALKVRFILFSVGLGAAIASSFVLIFFLYASLFNKPCLVYESNPLLASLEIILLIIGIGTCSAASEIYYKYLETQNT